MARPSPAVVHRRHSQPRQPSHGRWSGRSLRQARAARPAPTAGHGQRVLMMGRAGHRRSCNAGKEEQAIDAPYVVHEGHDLSQVPHELPCKSPHPHPVTNHY
uniref:Uncharacterized protein n=1 Tax=Setaria viridis TaxID=4556 RepID=A0A4U6VRB3_SETVI|nr:hypothetical protein SEVIR_2G099450v2 [Setaria viridis]